MISKSRYIRGLLEHHYQQLAGTRGTMLLAVLGLLSGVTVAVVVVTFRICIETLQSGFLPLSDPENYEGLSVPGRFLLAAAGGLLLGALFFLLARKDHCRVGVVHVLERLSYNEGNLPLKNALVQYLGGVIAIVTGQSVGREGPSIHLGAATGSILGQQMGLPNNSIRTLVACGSAGAIAASFNTPLAGVIFAMEVIMMEYTITGFAPVILAAVSATAINRLVFGSDIIFLVPPLQLASLWELPVILLMGVAIGGIAALFIRLLRWVTTRSETLPVWSRMALAGTGVGIIAISVPEVMGIGYETVNQALLGHIAIGLLLSILVAKLLATALCVGMGIPAGLIGPVFFMGAIIGSLTGLVLALVNPALSHPGLYAMLGMGAMMGATLHAPLAALLALLELTGNQNIIFPGMLAVVSASLATREIFGEDSIFLSQMRQLGLDYRNDPVAQSLRRLGVTAAMNPSFAFVQPEITPELAKQILSNNPQWLVIKREEGHQLMPATDLARALEGDAEANINVLEIPSKRKQLAPVDRRSSLQQAIVMLDESDAEALYVITPMGSSADKIHGVLTYEDIEKHYRAR